MDYWYGFPWDFWIIRKHWNDCMKGQGQSSRLVFGGLELNVMYDHWIVKKLFSLEVHLVILQ